MKNLFLPLLMFVFIQSAWAGNKLNQYKTLSIEIANRGALASLKACRKMGYNVAVAIVDPMGVEQVVIRDYLAGPHTTSTAKRKAWTAISFRQSTGELANMLAKGRIPNQVQHINKALLVGGGYKINYDGIMIAGIGVSGAPPGKSEIDSIDGKCAKAGIKVIKELLDFGD